MQLSAASFAGALRFSLLFEHVPPARAESIIQAAVAVINFNTVTHQQLRTFSAQIIIQARAPAPALAPVGTPAAPVKLTEPQVRMILGPVIKAAIALCAPAFDQTAYIAMWGAPVITLVLEPKTIIHSKLTAERIALIGADFRKKAPITAAAICAGPIPRPTERTTTAAIGFVLRGYFTRLVRQYLYKVGEEALQANRAFSSTVQATLLNKVLVDLGEQDYVTQDIPAGSQAKPFANQAKRTKTG